MSLLTKITLLFLVVALPVFGIGGVLTYHMVKREVRKETDYYLLETYRRIVQALEEGKPRDALINDKVLIRELPAGDYPDTLSRFSDTLGMHPVLDQTEPYRKLTRTTRIDSTYFTITLVDLLIESDDMYEGVVSVLSRLFLFLSVTLLLCSVLISRWLLQPFQKTLATISGFNLQSDEALDLPVTTTREFRLLNTFIGRMTRKVRQDYLALKEFTENASHEIQTPVSIAKGKLELLVESGDLTEEQVALIEGAHLSISKISRIGQGLSLLNKIGNLEFAESEHLDLSAVTEQMISHFRELAELKGLNLEAALTPQVRQKIPAALAEVMISNLIRNAIQHNLPGGWIQIELTEKHLKVRNTGRPPTASPTIYFERFRKGNQTSDSPGLGLSIVQKIVEVNDWTITYTFEDGVHQLLIAF